MMKKALSLIMLLLLFAALFVGCEDDDNSKNSTGDTAVTVDINATEAPLKTYVIKTDFADLKYPEKWKDIVKTEISDQDGYTVSFLADEKPIFEISFNSPNGDTVGTLILSDGNAVVRVRTEELDPKSENYQDQRMMQEDINVILTHLREDYDFVDGEVEDEDTEVFEIETDLATLYYPARWKDMVTVEADSSAIRFSSGETPVFDLAIDSDEGIFIGSYDGRELSVIDYPVEDEALVTMQEDINVILQYLQNDPLFTAAP